MLRSTSPSALSLRHSLAAFAVLACAAVLATPGCGSDADDTPGKKTTVDSGTGGSAGSAGSTGSGACFLNSCENDDHCSGCSFDRQKCLIEPGQSTGRCIACDPTKPSEGCGPGKECSSFGTCVELGKTCPTDGSGEPTITCQDNADCAACDPVHQICDQLSGKCVACIETNTSNCLPSDICVDNKCASKCPESCTVDNDCGQCESAGKKLRGCFNHKCAECSDTWACPSGLECQKGQCIKPCGLGGNTSGSCTDDAHCSGCGDPTGGGAAWKCKFPINGGTHGTCAAPAAGCSDLGQGVLVLPPPFDKVTNTCSNDANCQGVGIQYNVGETIRDLVGGSELDVFGKKIAIKDAIVNYGMPRCASVTLTDDISCGICVPCKQDSDCKKIELDPLVADLFKGDALASIAGKLLLELLYGDNDDHSLHFQCLPVAAGYGVCIPCANPTKSCSGTTSGSGSCDHDVCQTGGPLDPSCGTCAAEVCKNDSFCCQSSWDSLCVSSVDDYCASGCGGSGGGCNHGPCETGAALSSLCSPCVEQVCAADPFCCNQTNGSWDSLCVTKAQSTSACSSQCSGSGCAHSECTKGGPLTTSCSSCAAAVCATDSYCCNVDWDGKCVSEAQAESACSCN